MRDIMLMVHMLGLAMGLGTGFGFMFLGIAKKKMEAAEGKDFQIKSLVLGNMGRIGLALLIISGGYLMTPYWSTLGENTLLAAKLSLVIVFLGVIGMVESASKRAKITQEDKYLQKLEMLGKITLPLGLIIMILAVLTFH